MRRKDEKTHERRKGKIRRLRREKAVIWDNGGND